MYYQVLISLLHKPMQQVQNLLNCTLVALAELFYLLICLVIYVTLTRINMLGNVLNKSIAVRKANFEPRRKKVGVGKVSSPGM